MPGFRRHLRERFSFGLHGRSIAVERVQTLAIVKDLDIVKDLVHDLHMRLVAAHRLQFPPANANSVANCRA